MSGYKTETRGTSNTGHGRPPPVSSPPCPLALLWITSWRGKICYSNSWLNSQCFRWLNSYPTFFPLTQLVPHMFRVSMSSKHVIWESCYLNFRGLVLGCIEANFCKKLCVGNGHPYLMQYMGRVDVLPALARATCSLAQENNSFFGLKFKPKKDRQNEAWNSWIAWN